MDIGDIFDENKKLYEQAAEVAVDSKTFVENLDELKKLRNKKNVDQEHLEDLIETLENFKSSKTFIGREKLAKKYTEENGFLNYVEKGRNEVLEPVSVYATVPDVPSPPELLAAISHQSAPNVTDDLVVKTFYKDAEKTKPVYVLGLNTNIPDGMEVSSRLDIRGYSEKGKHINTLMDQDKRTIYAPITFLKKATFQPHAEKASKIVRGGVKGPFSVIKGKFENLNVSQSRSDGAKTNLSPSFFFTTQNVFS